MPFAALLLVLVLLGALFVWLYRKGMDSCKIDKLIDDFKNTGETPSSQKLVDNVKDSNQAILDRKEERTKDIAGIVAEVEVLEEVIPKKRKPRKIT